MTDPLTYYINFARLMVERDLRMHRAMAVQIKGLSGAVQQARKSISDLRAHAAGLQSDVVGLTQTITEIREQVKKEHDDLKFEAETLGNSGGTEEPEKPFRQAAE